MLWNLTALVGNALEDAQAAGRVISPAAADRGILTPPQSVLQLAHTPIPLDARAFRNARSPSNPRGSLVPLRAFTDLVDPVPLFGRDYWPGPNSTEQVYGNLVGGAVATDDQARRVIAGARSLFDLNFFPNLDGTVGHWRAVYARPDEWYDTSLYQEMSLAAAAEQTARHSFTVIPRNTQPEQLSWTIGAGSGARILPLQASTTISTIRLKYREVYLKREWLDAEIFSLQNWYVAGQLTGSYSTGDARSNDGVLPLLPISLIVGADTAVTATWSAEDRKIWNDGVATASPMALGPFVLQTGTQPGAEADSLESPAASIAAPPETLYIVGFRSYLVPLAAPGSSKMSKAV